MEVGIFGAGVVGSAIIFDTVRDKQISKIYIFDKSKERIKKLKEQFQTDKCAFIVADFQSDPIKIADFDLVYGALPGFLGFKFMKWVIEKGVNTVDVSFTPEDPVQLDRVAKDANVIVIPDAGFAPGLTNIITGDFYFNKFDELNAVRIYVGALPERPEPPLMHTITWSASDFLDEYIRPARIIRSGKITTIPPLSIIEEVNIPNLGTFEAFYSDGLRTLLNTIKITDLAELTIRFKGHLQVMRLLDQLGMFSAEKIEIDGIRISPRDVLVTILEKTKRVDITDITIMQIIATGVLKGEKKEIQVNLIDKYDENTNLSAIARTTGFVASAIGHLIIDGTVKTTGVLPPELLARDKNNLLFIKEYLKKREICLTESEQ